MHNMCTPNRQFVSQAAVVLLS